MGLAVFALVLSLAAVEPAGALPPSVSPAASCAVCHADVAAARSPQSDVHKKLACTECHPGRGFNPHVQPDLDADTRTQAEGFKVHAEHSPAAYTSCAGCHEDEVAAWRGSIHGRAGNGKPGPKPPGCADCHGSIHTVTKVAGDKLAMATRCIGCHVFNAERGPGNAAVVDTYRDTVHGKMLRLGNTRAAACADCHTGHNVYAVTDPRSSVSAGKRVQTCGRCHEHATEAFSQAVSHRRHSVDEDFWTGITALGFAALTVGTIFMLFLHVLVDFLRSGRRALSSREPAHAAKGPIAADAPVKRFSVHARLQHAGMLLSFTLLVLTGWPLKAASVGTSSHLVLLLGGEPTFQLIHRIAGSVLLAVALYHVAYLVVLFRRQKLDLGMLPTLDDLPHLIGNVLYFFGLKHERPKFGKWTYYEKFDYWAVFWGMLIMGGSGLILWFPVAASRILPGKLITLAHIAHSDEALLAALAIFLWHFYNVHLRPTVFPMSWVWLTGNLTAEALYEEHRGEYERLYGQLPPGPPAAQPTWHHQHRWSVMALVLILVVATAVVAADLSSVRQRLAEIQGPSATFALGASGAPAVPVAVVTPVSVYDPGFKVFDTCFACHNRGRFEAGEGGFAHKTHFDKKRVEASCANCHQGTWHAQTRVVIDKCLECHEPEDIGAAARPK